MQFDLSAVACRPQSDLCFVHVCDTHITDEESARIVADAAEAINQVRPDFVVFGGDLANHGAVECYEALKGATRRIDAPVHYIIGNHDFLGGKDTFAGMLGPLNYAFDTGAYHIICLDSTGRTSLTWEGLFSGRTVAWLERHLTTVDEGQPIILLCHHGLWSREPHSPKANLLWDVLNYKPIHAALRPHDVVLGCFGHAHQNAMQHWDGATLLWSGVLSTVRANHDGLPVGFRVVWVRDRSVQTAWVPVVD